MKFASALLLALGTVLWEGNALEPLPEPTGEVVLTVSGEIAHTNRGAEAVFDRAMLEALGLRELRTSTPWTEGVPVFRGVLARDLLQAVGADGTSVIASALNDYTVEIPTEDFERYPVMLALEMNGTPLTVRDKGPIWVVYPRDDFAAIRESILNARWVWQLNSLEVR